MCCHFFCCCQKETTDQELQPIANPRPPEEKEHTNYLLSASNYAASFIGEAFNMLGSPLFVGMFVDCVGDYTPEVFGVSYYGLYAGLGVGVFATLGAMYGHYTNNYTRNHGPKDPKEAGQVYEASKHLSLYWWQKGLVACHYIQDGLEYANKIAFPYSILASKHLSRQTNVNTYSAMAVWGLFCSISSTNSSANTMRHYNAIKNYEENKRRCMA